MRPNVLALALLVFWLATSAVGQQGTSQNPLNDSGVEGTVESAFAVNISPAAANRKSTLTSS